MKRKHYAKGEKVKLYKKFSLVVLVFAVICIAIVGVATVLPEHNNSKKKVDQEQSTAELDKDIVTINGVKCKPNWDVKTYLYIGEDSRGIKKRNSETNGTGQSDVLELIVLNTKENTYYKLPINRDSITDVKSLDEDGSYLATTKVQIAFAHANGDGMESSCENTVDAVSDMLYGIKIDGYIAMNIDAIKVINHLAGGVPVTIEDDFSQSDSSHYVHDRMNVGDGTNVCRMRRQKEYIDALYPIFKNKLKSDSGFINTFYNDLSDYMVTDMSVGEMGNLANTIIMSEDKGELSIDGTNALDRLGFNAFTVDKTSLGDVAMKLFFKKAE